MHSIDLVILANSIKHLGHCIAGKDIHSGKWVRLINYEAESSGKPLPFGVTELAFCFGSEKGPKIMSTYRILFSDPCPLTHQPENIRVVRGKWVILQDSPSQLPNLIDKQIPNWLIHCEGDKSDRIPISFIDPSKPLSQSLFFLRLFSHNKWKISRELAANGGLKYRLEFMRFGLSYDLAIKDYFINNTLEKFYQEKIKERKWGEKIDYSQLLGDPIYITIGLGEAFSPYSSPGHFFHFKLVVGLIGSKKTMGN